MTTPTPKSYWIERDGSRVLIGPASVLVGRGADCDIVLSDARVSRYHALFRLTEQGVEVIPFGRQPIALNGAAVSAPTALRAGDRIECFDQVFELIEGDAAPPADAVLWGIERSPGALYRIAQSPFRVGGAADDHLCIVGWSPGVLLLHRVGDGLALEALRDGVHCGADLSPGECVRLASGAKITHAGQRLRVLAMPGDPSQITAASGRDDLPGNVELRFLPRGGRLTLRVGGRTCSVYLADRRCDLIACLLQPKPPASPGDLVADEALIERIWPDREQTRVELNTLIFRTRKDLIKAGVDGTALLVREGGSVRFGLAPGATTRVFGA